MSTLAHDLHVLVALMDRAAETALAQSGGTTFQRQLTLIVIDSCADTPPTQRELATAIGQSESATSRMVASLVEDGLVHRTSPGGRRYTLTLTERGRDVLELGNRALAGSFDAFVADQGVDADALAGQISHLVGALRTSLTRRDAR